MRFESTQNPNADAASGRIAPRAAETVVSRGDWIRTSDLPAPSRMRYQTAPRPVERVRGLEPPLSAWKADVQPLHHTLAQPSVERRAARSIRTYGPTSRRRGSN